MGVGEWIQRRRLVRTFESDPRFRVVVGEGEVMCPYCLEVVSVEGAAASRDGFLQLVEHIVHECEEFEDGKEPRDMATLRRRVRLNAVVENIRSREAWRVVDVHGAWFCPYCCTATQVHWRKDVPLEKIASEILAHLDRCFEYSQHPGSFASVDRLRKEIEKQRREKNLAARLRMRVEKGEEVFLQRSPDDKWICPYCLKVVESVSMATEVLMRFTAPVQMAQHLLYQCAAALSGESPHSIDEVRRVVNDLRLRKLQRAVEQPRAAEAPSVLELLKSEIAAIRQEMKRNETLEESLKKAKEVVARMLPERIPQPPGYSIACYFKPCSQVGGDFYDFIPLGEEGGRIGIVVGDVSGHGLEAALVMGMTRKAITVRAVEYESPKDVIVTANADVYPDLDRKMFVTCFYGVFDPARDAIEFVRAGHTFSLVFRRQRGEVEVLKSGGMALGMTGDVLFGKTVQSVTASMGPGDVFVQYTDGIIEALNTADEEYGMERFLDSVARHAGGTAQQMLEGLIHDLQLFTRGAEQNDDMTIVVIKHDS